MLPEIVLGVGQRTLRLHGNRLHRVLLPATYLESEPTVGEWNEKPTPEMMLPAFARCIGVDFVSEFLAEGRPRSACSLTEVCC